MLLISGPFLSISRLIFSSQAGHRFISCGRFLSFLRVSFFSADEFLLFAVLFAPFTLFFTTSNDRYAPFISRGALLLIHLRLTSLDLNLLFIYLRLISAVLFPFYDISVV